MGVRSDSLDSKTVLQRSDEGLHPAETQEQGRDYRGSDELDGVASMQHAQPGQSTASSSSGGSGSTASGRNEKLIWSAPFSSLAGGSMYLFAIDSPGQSQSLFCLVLEIAEPVTLDKGVAARSVFGLF